MARKSVKVVNSTSELQRSLKNDAEERKIKRTSIGSTSYVGAKVTDAFNKTDKAMGKKTTVVKVNSANPTRQGTTPTIRKAGGLMGGGGAGNWRNLFK
jgi:hypothetical protein